VATPYVFYNKPFRAFLGTSEISKNTDIIVTFRKHRANFVIRPDKPSSSKVISFNYTNSMMDMDEVEYPELTIVVHREGKCSRKTVEVVDEQLNMYSFIQLDKPVYKPGDNITYRVVVFDEETIPVAITTIGVSIVDDTGVSVYNETKDGNIGMEEFGLFNDTFSIAREVNTGTWRMQVRINDNIFTEKFFPVEDYKLPFYELVLDHPEYVFFSEKTFKVRVYGKYRFGKNANGKGTFTIKEINADGTIGEKRYGPERFVVKGEAIQEINFKKDLSITSILRPKAYQIQVKFTDDGTNTAQNANSNFTVKKNKDFRIEFINPPKLVPGQPYEIQVCVKNHKGKSRDVLRFFKFFQIPHTERRILSIYQFVIMKAKRFEEEDDEDGISLGIQSQKLRSYVLSFKVETTPETRKLEFNFAFEHLQDIIYEVNFDNDISNEIRLIVNEKK
jgi:hypothetical protein